ncbi:MAG TPA: BON domain-containing protein [Chloroflexota bacterium]|nr:BON domain-containing protein [Chloroflexota bacterium]
MATAQPTNEPRLRPPTQYDVPAAPPDVTDPADQPGFTPVLDEGLSDADSELLYRVSQSIDRYEPIRASGSRIQVALRQGSVVLTGRVRSQPLQVMAERLGAAAAGGRPFVSELLADPTISIAVATALALDPRTNLAPVYVDCSLGTVRLQGAVPSAAMVEAATEVARGVPGVADVRNDLVAVAAPSAPSVAEAKVEAGAASKPTADTAFTSEPRSEPHGRTQNADLVTRPEGDQRVPVSDT